VILALRGDGKRPTRIIFQADQIDVYDMSRWEFRNKWQFVGAISYKSVDTVRAYAEEDDEGGSMISWYIDYHRWTDDMTFRLLFMRSGYFKQADRLLAQRVAALIGVQLEIPPELLK
jgi:hypothetical protein